METNLKVMEYDTSKKPEGYAEPQMEKLDEVQINPDFPKRVVFSESN